MVASKAMSFSIFELECLDEHNQLRAKHGCPPLKLDRNMCKYAQQWAQNLAARRTLQHRTERQYGENLYMSSGTAVDGRRAVKDWYAEIANYRTPTFAFNTGHFTQVVWRGSQRLGVGIAKSGNATYVVANYDPPGNFMGQFQQNVPVRSAYC